MSKITDLLNSNHQQTSSNSSLSDFFKSGVVRKKLIAGAYSAKLLSAELMENATDPSKSYVKMTYILPEENGRQLTDNRFDKGFHILLSQITQQLSLDTEDYTVPELLSVMETQPFTIWISYQIVNGNTYRNINFIAPKEPSENDVD